MFLEKLTSYNNQKRKIPSSCISSVSIFILFILLLISCNTKKKDAPAPDNSNNSTTYLPDSLTAKPDSVTKADSIKKEIAAQVKKYNEGDLSYSLISKDSLKKIKDQYTAAELTVISNINRTERKFLSSQDSVLIPSKLNLGDSAYFPFPTEIPQLYDVKKIILFSYPAEAYAAYENGKMILTGPTNMGKAKTPTPTGLFFCNWKAKESVSTSNDEWILKWNFNIQNNMGVGFHQYDLPGYPASHSCLRLLMSDAEFLYNWAEQWKLLNSSTVLAKGTPVIVFGSYPFGKRRPWRALAQNAQALNFSPEDIDGILNPYLSEIMKQQNHRDSVVTYWPQIEAMRKDSSSTLYKDSDFYQKLVVPK